MYGPVDMGNSRQSNGSSQAKPSSIPTETPSSANSESIEKMLMESQFLRKLAEDQAALADSHALLLHNQEKLLKGQKNLTFTLNQILNELRSGKCDDKDPSVKPKNNQKRVRLSNGENENDAKPNATSCSKKSKLEIPLNIDKKLYFNHSLTKICVICKKRYERIVNHYKQCHSLSEVVASRLSPEMANELQKDLPKSLIVVKNIDNLIEAKCAFCEDEKAFTATYWPNHIQAHTGLLRKRLQEYYNEYKSKAYSNSIFSVLQVNIKINVWSVVCYFHTHHIIASNEHEILTSFDWMKLI